MTRSPEGRRALVLAAAVSAVPLGAWAQCAPEVCACELDLFRRLLDDVDIEREQRVIDGDHLCCYRLKPKAS